MYRCGLPPGAAGMRRSGEERCQDLGSRSVRAAFQASGLRHHGTTASVSLHGLRSFTVPWHRLGLIHYVSVIESNGVAAWGGCLGCGWLRRCVVRSSQIHRTALTEAT